MLSNLSKEHHYTLAMLLGVMCTLSMPPFYNFAAMVIALSGFYVVLRYIKNIKQAFFLGWWFGFGYFCTGLYWLIFPLLIKPEFFGYLIPFAFIGIPFVLSSSFAISAAIIFWVDARNLIGVIVYALMFTIANWILEVFFGFPWNLFAYAWSFSIEMLQTASIIGTYGMIFLAVFCSVSIGSYICDKSKLSCVFSLILIVSMSLYGKARLRIKQDYDKNVFLRVVQANIGVEKIFLGDKEILCKHLYLTNEFSKDKIKYAIWPESSISHPIIDNNVTFCDGIGKLKVDFVIAGGLRAHVDKYSNAMLYYNSLFVFNKDGKIVSYYDKRHLVPFGEYIPFVKFLSWIIPNAFTGNFTVGSTTNSIMSLNDTPEFAPLICYECIFPGEVASRYNNAKWLINITNDAWYGVSSQPYQHFEFSRMRGIEGGIPVIRAANNGISAVTDSYGRIEKMLPSMTVGIIDTYLPLHINGGTIYSCYVYPYKILSVIAVIVFMFCIVRKFINAVNKY
ncbi:apolipoprotein N-acyltransferase [Neoehrlichia mikurensis]|uniref:Apolipoprotein N-acyltransferase n=1 Tax=Neoehrlichia mikurensis TaxID=89586 RepID=A0A9Q9F3J5_9RICK|nr:apolipoprotein N-acyltransferase [Neoehrlichia mikurensis]QXK92222.1 apolipoprotein N-acyltransferase [Neoehrlichia mikurensis]QXK92677.1 apolipoprotein N-acyltransferase [Neoehrlichia mikurensis]QXK93915.1 apolipoprotein N-acyltransferase [Neoehrlichia mikurensis]UTO55083.1 apolipoprotein N-acyltransferase [Neoehrlichia mikurensis]UTO56002.1 apolipoprotein N-acyltransferase [Neoehrlichia mikurensis]